MSLFKDTYENQVKVVGVVREIEERESKKGNAFYIYKITDLEVPKEAVATAFEFQRSDDVLGKKVEVVLTLKGEMEKVVDV
jgi:DNA polymerase III alpha subunit